MGPGDGPICQSLLFTGPGSCVFMQQASAWLCWEQILRSPSPLLEVVGVHPLLENVMTDSPTPQGPLTLACTLQIVKCFQHQPVAWLDEDQGPWEETRLRLLLLDSAPHVGIILLTPRFLSPVCAHAACRVLRAVPSSPACDLGLSRLPRE